jgi:hypothetical protein
MNIKLLSSCMAGALLLAGLTAVQAADSINSVTVTDVNNDRVTCTVRNFVVDTGGTVTITASDDCINVVSDPTGNIVPLARNDSASTTPSASTTINVLANDTQGDPTVSVSTGQPPQGQGFASVNVSNQIVYDPQGFAGPDTSFSYTITDGDGETSTAVVTVAVSDKSGGGGDGSCVDGNGIICMGELTHGSHHVLLPRGATHVYHFQGTTQTQAIAISSTSLGGVDTVKSFAISSTPGSTTGSYPCKARDAVSGGIYFSGGASASYICNTPAGGDFYFSIRHQDPNSSGGYFMQLR